MRPPDVLLAVLVVMNVALAGVGWSRARPTTYVFTPLVEVVPGTRDAVEASEIRASLRQDLDARAMEGAYARLGAAMSLDDLLRGIELLDDLAPAQESRIGTLLAGAQADRAALLDVQREALDLEGALVDLVREIDPTDGGARP